MSTATYSIQWLRVLSPGNWMQIAGITLPNRLKTASVTPLPFGVVPAPAKQATAADGTVTMQIGPAAAGSIATGKRLAPLLISWQRLQGAFPHRQVAFIEKDVELLEETEEKIVRQVETLRSALEALEAEPRTIDGAIRQAIAPPG